MKLMKLSSQELQNDMASMKCDMRVPIVTSVCLFQ